MNNFSKKYSSNCCAEGRQIREARRRGGRSRISAVLCRAVLAGLLATVPMAWGQDSGGRKLGGEFKVGADKAWLDTGLDLIPGDRVTVTGEGTVQYAPNQTGPEGIQRSWRDLARSLPVNGAGVGALIGRIGGDVAVPFLIGANREITSNQTGRLFLGINQESGGKSGPGEGTYTVKVQVVPGKEPPQQAAKPVVVSPDVLAKLPQRITDSNGGPGDMVNFLLLGPEDKVKQVFKAAGWVQVDKTKVEGVLHALLSSTTKEAYVEMPMSELYLFGRPQDFGFARAEPVQVVASRNHLRIWKAPFQNHGQTVWVGAATHDIGFERDMRKPDAVTHKIDPAVDAEREFVGQTLSATGLVAGTTYLTPANPLKEAKTATGGSFHSDGRVLVMELR